MTKRPAYPHAFALSVALAVVGGCDATHVLGTADGGQNNQSPGTAGTNAGAAGVTGAGGAAGGATTTGTGGAAGAKVDPATLGPSESWTGYLENRTFSSGSDMLVLKFATDANGVVAGTIVFGVGTPPPPATDPNVGYPSNLTSSVGPGPGSAMGYIAEGYSYAFDGGSLDTHRLRFTANLSQLWAGWCALQTPASDGSGWCLPNWASMYSTTCAQLNPQTQKYVPVDCGKLSLCGPSTPCACTATKCGLSATSSSNAAFDIFLTGATASGSADMPFFGMNNVHFVKN